MIKVILWDIDNTLLDFLAAESASLKASFAHFGFGECSDEMVEQYSKINNKYWEMLERGELTKQKVLEGRFFEFFAERGLDSSLVPEFNRFYEKGLSDTVIPIENSIELVRSLKGKYHQYAVTNGAEAVQTRKLAISGLSGLFDGVFISDRIGFEKPSREFFCAVLDSVVPCEKEEIIIVGDSLTSDMKGGNNIGIKCCWYNPRYAENTKNVKVDYEIHSLDEILQIV